jgi:hypothetical protein
MTCMKCPWCEEEMQPGDMTGDGRSRVRFRPEGKKLTFGENLAGIGLLSAARYTWGGVSIPAHYCRRCCRIVIETKVET